MTRGGLSSLIAFSVPTNVSVDRTAFKIIGTHTDSPSLRLAPKFEASSCQAEQSYVQCYGGGLWHTWLDRDLKLGGRVSVKEGTGIEVKLFQTENALAKIPTLAIHLQKDSSTLKIDKEVELRPIFASSLADGDKKHRLRDFIAGQVGAKLDDIIDFDICFADTAESSRFGLDNEFLSAPRLDNLVSVFCSIPSAAQAADICVLAMFDHEEIGSQTRVGADSSFLKHILKRVLAGLKFNQGDSFARVASRSFLLSADMAHGQHPNFSSYHQAAHTPKINQGIVLKINCNNRYATDAISGGVLKRIAEAAQIPLNEFIVSNESRCGTTIGPILSSKLGFLTADIGGPLWGMHSIRETGGVVDFHYYTELMKNFFEIQMIDVLPKNP